MNPQTYLADLRQRAAGNQSPAYAYELGLVLLYGRAENTPDPAEAALWLSRAKHGGIRLSENVYEDLLASGYRLLSVDECRRWRRDIGKLKVTPDLPAVSMTPEQVFAACRADADTNPDAAFLLANLYDTGYGCTADADQALYWYTRAMRGGHGEAAQRLADHYAAQNRAREAEEAYHVLAKNGDVVAQVQLFLWHNVPQPAAPEPETPDAATLFARCKAAAETGDVDSQAMLGLMLMHGHGCEQNADEAAIWLIRAAEAKQPMACYELSLLLWEKDPHHAFTLAHYAAQCGIVAAMKTMVVIYDHLDELGPKVTEHEPHLANLWARRLVAAGDDMALLYLVKRCVSGSGLGSLKPFAAHQFLVQFVRTASAKSLTELNPNLVMQVAMQLFHSNYKNTSAIWLTLLARQQLKYQNPELGRRAAYQLDETSEPPFHQDDLNSQQAYALYNTLAAYFAKL